MQTQQHFRDEKDPDGFPWAKHSWLTLKGRRKGRKSKRSPKILQDKGILIKSNVAMQESPDELKIENKLPYAAPNQKGATEKVSSKRQAWWMVFNLFGFDPKAPWKFTRTARRAKQRGTKLRKDAREGLTWDGWRKATAIAMKLLGSTINIPVRMFLGFSEKEGVEIRMVWEKWFSKIAKEKV